MQEELLQFKLQNVWTLVDLSNGYTQEEGIDYDEDFAPVSRIEAIRAWYETLSTYLIENGFRRGTIDKTLFIKNDKGDILLVQVYVDDIIFGSTKKSLCDKFEGLMHKRFQMSSMGELTFFLGLQVQQKKDGIFISQDKYMAKILKKFNFATIKTASTPMEPNNALVKDEEADNIDVHLYRSMIGSLMYLTASRPDIMFAVCACARDSPFNLKAFSDSDYAGASLDRKSTIGEIRHHFIRDSYEKKLIQVIKIYKDYNVADLLTKAFYVSSCKINAPRQDKHIEYLVLNWGEDMQHQTKVDDEAVHKELGDRMERAATTASSLEVEQDSDAQTSTLEDGEVEITTTIDGQLKTITEASLRRHLKLEDADGISSLPNVEIFEQLAFMSILVQGPIQQGEGSTVPVESHHTPITTPSTSQSLLSSPSKKVYGNAYTKLIMRVKKLEHKVKSRKPRRRARVVISDTEEDLEDPSKQGRIIAKIDQNHSISLVQDKGTSLVQKDAEIQGRTSADTEILLD
ncbi:putative ribonuclease H-like domain-containing protein [Tanacetum coccineum]